MVRRCTLPFALLSLVALFAAEAPRAHAQCKLRSVSRRHRAPRLSLLRTTLRAHAQLKASGLSLPLPKSGILSNKTAAAKRYSDSWTCRESSRALIRSLEGKGVKLKLDSSGKNTFDWGAEGKVSYHYYAVDNTQRPTLLVDPTAASNFSRDAIRGGMMHGLLHRAATALGQSPKVADKIARRVQKGKNGLLVLTRTNEIDVYRNALDQAAKLRSSRDAERAK